jgi:hypothetical protein
VRSDVVIAIKMLMLVFLVVTMCELMGGYQRLREYTAPIFRTEEGGTL